MAPPRKPVEHLRLVGSFRKDKHADREHVPAPTGELGPPPAHLADDESKAWDELSTAAPWCTDADRMVVELAAKLMALSRRERLQAALVAQLQIALGRLGLSPADRRKVLIRPATPAAEPSALSRLAAKRRPTP